MGSQDLAIRATELAFAMLRFTQPSAHPFPSDSTRAGGEGGVDWFIFSPAWHRTTKDEVVPFLLGLGCPLMILPTTYRGHVALLVLDELKDERQRWLQKTLDNQGAGLDELGRALALTPDSLILLEFADEELIFSFATVREWGQRYCVGVGWSLAACEDSRADARFMLLGPEGRKSSGGSCPMGPAE